MNKKLLGITILAANMLATAACAAPLSDYSAGKMAVDVGFNWGGKFVSEHSNVNNATAMNAGITVGLGHKLAVQYKYDNWQRKVVASKYYDTHMGYQKHQLNLLYQVVPGISPYIGWRCDRGTLQLSGSRYNLERSKVANAPQLGILAQHKFANNKATIWADIAVSTSNTQDYEIGLGYEVIKNVDLNVTYQYNHIDKNTIKGFTTGITYKF